ncbi:MAG: SBBP repeat-containing protein [Thermodesulfobacteriota bacterium]
MMKKNVLLSILFVCSLIISMPEVSIGAGDVTVIAGGVSDPAAVSMAELKGPTAVFVDPSYNIYIADSGNHRIQRVASAWPNEVTTVVGGGSARYVEGMQASEFALGSPSAVLMDAAGNIYIADSGLSLILKVDNSTNVVTTVLGGDSIKQPGDIFLSGTDLYIADTGNHRILKVAGGSVTTVAGNGAKGYSGDDVVGGAANAELSGPEGVYVDGTGDIYIADTYNNRIRKVTGTTISTVAGNGERSTIRDGRDAKSAGIGRPRDIIIDSAGDIIIAETRSKRVRKVDMSANIITTVAGGYSKGGPMYDGLAATQANIGSSEGIFIDSSGNLYIADGYNNRVRMVGATGIIDTVAGVYNNKDFIADGTKAIETEFYEPVDVDVDAAGNVYIADAANNRVRVIYDDGGVAKVRTIAGTGSPGYSGDGGNAKLAMLNGPQSVVHGSDGVTYIADTKNNRIRRVGSDGNISYVAGYDQATGDFGFRPSGISDAGFSNIYISDIYNNRILRAHASGGTSFITADNMVPEPRVAVRDSSGNIYVAESGRISRVNNATDVVTVTDKIRGATDIAIDGVGNLYVTSDFEDKLYKVTPSGVVTTLLNNSVYVTNTGQYAPPSLRDPQGVAVDSAGNVYVADTGNRRILKLWAGDIDTDFATTLATTTYWSNPDHDNDGIINGMDKEPYNSSVMNFEFGVHTGEIINRGNQALRIGAGGIPGRILIHSYSGTTQAEVSTTCDGATLTSYISANDSFGLSCGSTIIGVTAGPVDFKFQTETGTVITTTVNAGNTITFDSTGSTITADATNTENIVVTSGGQDYPVPPGVTLTIGAVVADADGDGVEDGLDNCPSDINPTQSDTDGDGMGNACDADIDGDGVLNIADNCPYIKSAQPDADSDGVGNGCENSLVGVWGTIHLDASPPSSSVLWSSRFEQLILNPDGEGAIIYGRRHEGSQLEVDYFMKFTWSEALNADGTVTITYNTDSGFKEKTYAISDNGTVMVLNSLPQSGLISWNVGLRLVPGRTYTNSDLSGDYYTTAYSYSAGGNYKSVYAKENYDAGLGKTGSSIFSENLNAIFKLNASAGGGIPYTVDPDGFITLNGVPKKGFTSPGGGAFILSDTDDPNLYSAKVGIKTGDRIYTNADLAGKWFWTIFNEEHTNTPTKPTYMSTLFGTMTCRAEAVNNCDFSLEVRELGMISTTAIPFNTDTLTVSADGTITSKNEPFSLLAIGNDGNTMIGNGSFEATFLDHRSVIVGVCITCAGSSPPSPPSLTIDTSSLSFGSKDTAYSASMLASGGDGSYTWSVSAGSLPTGLSLNTSTGLISGTPTTLGTSTFTIQLTDGNSDIATQAYTLTVYDVAALDYAIYLGGSHYDYAQSIAVDSSGAAYVTGVTNSTNFPTAFSLYGDNTGADVFVTKINASGSDLIYSTYLGGTNEDLGHGIAVDSSGDVYVTGQTNSTDFPTVSAIDGSSGGFWDGFVMKINSAGTNIIYSTYLGGANNDLSYDIAVDSSGAAYVTGQTESTNFPTVSAIYGSNSGGTDVFVTKINSAGFALDYSTYLGGTSNDVGSGIAIDSSGSAYVTGYTYSINFPTTAVAKYGSHSGGGTDAFVTKINSAGSALDYSTFLGGFSSDAGSGIAVDSSGSAYVTGKTLSLNFPVTPLAKYQTHSGVDNDAFVTKINVAGSELIYSTYLGGAKNDIGQAIAVDSSGNAYVTGTTFSLDFPTVSAKYGSLSRNEWNDAFVTRVNPGGTALTYSTYFGGGGSEYGNGIAVDQAGAVYVAGRTDSFDLPNDSIKYGTNRGGADAFVAKITPVLASSPPSGDTDGDGIFDTVDTEPANPASVAFSDGTSFGAITTIGDQTLEIKDAVDSLLGVIVTVISSAGSNQTVVTACSDNSKTYFDAVGDSVTITCGSSIVKVRGGSVDFEFRTTGGTVVLTTLSEGEGVTFKPETGELIAPPSNSKPVVVEINGTESKIEPGEINLVKAPATPVTAPVAPPAKFLKKPKKLQAKMSKENGKKVVVLSWKDMSGGEDGFVIERSLKRNGGGEEKHKIGPNETKYVDTNVDFDKHRVYFYRIWAYNSITKSRPTEKKPIRRNKPIRKNDPVAKLLKKPKNLRVGISEEDGKTVVKLKWNDKSDGEDGFIIERRIKKNRDWEEIERTGPNDTNYEDENVDFDKHRVYFYRVKAFLGTTESRETQPKPVRRKNGRK